MQRFSVVASLVMVFVTFYVWLKLWMARRHQPGLRRRRHRLAALSGAHDNYRRLDLDQHI